MAKKKVARYVAFNNVKELEKARIYQDRRVRRPGGGLGPDIVARHHIAVPQLELHSNAIIIMFNIVLLRQTEIGDALAHQIFISDGIYAAYVRESIPILATDAGLMFATLLLQLMDIYDPAQGAPPEPISILDAVYLVVAVRLLTQDVDPADAVSIRAMMHMMGRYNPPEEGLPEPLTLHDILSFILALRNFFEDAAQDPAVVNDDPPQDDPPQDDPPPDPPPEVSPQPLQNADPPLMGSSIIGWQVISLCCVAWWIVISSMLNLIQKLRFFTQSWVYNRVLSATPIM